MLLTPAHFLPNTTQGISNESLSECESTYTDDEYNEDDEPPPVATGKDLEYMTRALEVAKKSGDPHTKVALHY